MHPEIKVSVTGFHNLLKSLLDFQAYGVFQNGSPEARQKNADIIQTMAFNMFGSSVGSNATSHLMVLELKWCAYDMYSEELLKFLSRDHGMPYDQVEDAVRFLRWMPNIRSHDGFTGCFCASGMDDAEQAAKTILRLEKLRKLVELIRTTTNKAVKSFGTVAVNCLDLNRF